MAPNFKLLYWPTIPGRGEFIRLAFEATKTPYSDVSNEQSSPQPILDLINPDNQIKNGDTHFAPPVLDHDGFLVGQTPAILGYLGPILGLAPKDEQGRARVNEITLTILDLVNETHDSHHPIAVSKIYENQKEEALKRSAAFIDERIPKFLGTFERTLAVNKGSQWLYGKELTYADLTLFQAVDGLKFAFPTSMGEIQGNFPEVFKLYERVRALEAIKAYLNSNRRQQYSQGVFRHYPELDVPTSKRQ